MTSTAKKNKEMKKSKILRKFEGFDSEFDLKLIVAHPVFFWGEFHLQTFFLFSLMGEIAPVHDQVEIQVESLLHLIIEVENFPMLCHGFLPLCLSCLRE